MFKDLKVESLTKQNLQEALHKNLFWEKGLAPMPKSKAEWLINNDRINDDDYVGVTGFEQNELVAFIYMIPDFLNIEGNDEVKKVYWMISWWVDPKFKDTILGTYVFNEALNITQKQIIIKSYAEGVTEFYEKQPFNVICERNRYTIFFNLDTPVFLGKFPKLKKVKFLVKKMDQLSYLLLEKLNKKGLSKRLRKIKYTQIESLDNETWEFLGPKLKENLILKNKEYINWQLSAKQYTQKKGSKLPYTFLQTGISPNISIYNVKMLSNDNVNGFFSFVHNFNEINIKYFIAKDESRFDNLVDLLISFLYKIKAHYIFTDNQILAESIKAKFKTIFVYKVNKKGLAHNKLKCSLDNLSLTEGDGHFY